MNENVLAILKNPLLFMAGIVGAVLCLILGVYYAIPGIYHISLGHTHPPMNPRFSYVAAFLVLAVVCAVIAILSRRMSQTK